MKKLEDDDIEFNLRTLNINDIKKIIQAKKTKENKLKENERRAKELDKQNRQKEHQNTAPNKNHVSKHITTIKTLTVNLTNSLLNKKTNFYEKEDFPAIKECPICFSTDEEFILYECEHSLCIKCACRIICVVRDKRCPICQKHTKIKPPRHFLDIKCQKCEFTAPSRKELIEHYKSHSLYLCTFCMNNRHQFPSEYALFTGDQLHQHLRHGLESENEESFYGHPRCIFCLKYFYSLDFLIKHARDAHFQCTICQNVGGRYSFLNTGADLSAHMREAHFSCPFMTCAGVAFAYKSDYILHMLKEHKSTVNTYDANENKKESRIEIMNPHELEKARKNRRNDYTKTQKRTPPKLLSTREPTAYSSVMPEYLNRDVTRIETRKQDLLREILEKKYKEKSSEIHKNFLLFGDKKISPEIFLERVSIVLGGNETIKFGEDIVRFCDLEGKKVLTEYLVVYKRRILFPKFTKDSVKIETPPAVQKRDSFKFKIINIKKNKK